MNIKNIKLFEPLCKFLLSILFIKFTISIMHNSTFEISWQSFLFIVLIFVSINMPRIIRLFIGAEGLEIELDKIETTKKEIIEIQKDIKNTYKQMLHLFVAFIESTKRQTWSGPPNYDELISMINANCKNQGFTKTDTDYVFAHKTLWEEKDKKTNKRN